MWIIRPLEVTRDGGPSGRWRLTATSDEDGGGPFGDPSHDHATAKEADECERCDEYCARISGFPSKKQDALDLERRERAELERLKKIINRRGFLGLLLSAPAAAIAALRPTPEVAVDPGGADETAAHSSTRAAGARWSDTTSNPIADIEAAMKEIRARSGHGPRDVCLYVPPGLYVRHPELYRVAL